MKRIIALAAAAVLLLAALGACAGASSAAAKTLPAAEDGLIFSITTYDGATEAEPLIPCLGHAWLSLDNRTDRAVMLHGYELAPGETLTFSAWALSERRGVVFNLEPTFIRQCGRYEGRQSLSVCIDQAQLDAIGDYIRAHDTWTFTGNCSRWSEGCWNAVVGEDARLTVPGLIRTPERLKRAMRAFDGVETDRDFSAAGDVFFVQDGVRKEWTLCR